MKIAIGSDHAAFEEKQKTIEYLVGKGYEVKDFGTDKQESCNYPEYAHKVAEAVANGEYERGILMCGTGIGMSMTANRHKGVRAALVHDEYTAKMSREHNDSNILCLGARVLDYTTIERLVDLWLNTGFSGEEKHRKRIDLINN